MRSATNPRLALLAIFGLTVLAALQLTSATDEAQCPESPNMRSCGRLTPNLPRCIANGLVEIIRYLKDGVKNLGIRRLEPLAIPNITAKDSSGKELILSNGQLYGGSEVLLPSFTTDLTSSTNWTITVPKFKFVSSYTMSEGFLGATANKGRLTLEMPGYTADFICNPYVYTGVCNETYAAFRTCRSKFVKTTSFKATFSALGSQAANIKQSELLNVLTTAFAPVQGNLKVDYLNEIYERMPTLDAWLPYSHLSYIPFCLQRRPTKCQ